MPGECVSFRNMVHSLAAVDGTTTARYDTVTA